MFEKQTPTQRESRARSSFTYRAEPSLSAPGLDQLIQFESQFKAIEEKTPSSSIRQLNESKKKNTKTVKNPKRNTE